MAQRYFSFVIFGVFTTITNGCQDVRVSTGSISNLQVNTNTHIPVSTVKSYHLTQCIQDCFYVSACNYVNYELTSQSCYFFNITGSVASVDDPTLKWKAVSLSDVSWKPEKNICDTNACASGESCFHIGNKTCVVI